MEKFSLNSSLDGYYDCGNECPECGLVIWTFKIETDKCVGKPKINSHGIPVFNSEKWSKLKSVSFSNSFVSVNDEIAEDGE